VIDPVALANAGGWAVVVAILLAIGLGVVREWWIPGGVYRREVKRADEAEARLAKVLTKIRADPK
jgi:hypothetical protein